jgi:hypothetical protein
VAAALSKIAIAVGVCERQSLLHQGVGVGVGGLVSCRGGRERKHTVGGRILGAKPPRARRWVKANFGNRPRPADAKEPTTPLDNDGGC